MRRILSVAAIALVAVSASASAQARRTTVMTSGNPSPEIGMDAGVTFSTGNGASETDINFPAQHVRMGFFMSPALSIEPVLGLTRSSSEGTSATLYNIGVGALYHFSTSRADNQVYVRPFINLLGASVNVSGVGSDSDSDVLFGAGLGVKMPLRDQLAMRFEGNIGRLNEAKTNAFGLLAGLSFYTR